MSLPDFIQNNLEFLIDELDARAALQLMANGHVEDRLLDIVNGLESYLPKPAPTVQEDPVAVAAFMDGVPHEQFDHTDDVVETPAAE
jgi:hypothetical protein